MDVKISFEEEENNMKNIRLIKQNDRNNNFKYHLRYLYKKIDKLSNLLWSHGNCLLMKKLRSLSDKNESNWKNETTAQLGYGEITMGAMTNFFNILQNMSIIIPNDDEKIILFPREKYNLCSSSLFIDIGSGFGKPTFHAAMQTSCKSVGIEVVPARVEFCMDFYYEYVENKKYLDSPKDDINAKKVTDEDNNINKINGSDRIYEKEFTLLNYNSSSDWIFHDIKLDHIALPDNTSNYPLITLDYFTDRIIETNRNSFFKPIIVKDPISNIVKEEKNIVQNRRKKILRKRKRVIGTSSKRLSTEEAKEIKKSAEQPMIKFTKIPLQTNFNKNWHEKVLFEVKDAGTIEVYKDENGRDFTHIYSYNKIMGKDCIRKICKGLNNTKFKVLAWYFNPSETRKCGLKNVKCIYKMPMQSTGSEKFTVYIYIKIL